MKLVYTVLLVPVVMVAACKGNDSKQVDSALNNDLTSASQPYDKMDTVSSAERTGGGSAVHHTTHSYSSSSSSSSNAAPAPTYHTEKHGGRDAAIGAGAGAILGAATSKNKLKGGVIGAAAGGILGAVIGNNVDKKTVKN
jgi:hypothetical protein